jgi:hypothetical protein
MGGKKKGKKGKKGKKEKEPEDEYMPMRYEQLQSIHTTLKENLEQAKINRNML